MSNEPEPTLKYLSFFFDWGWLVFLILTINETYFVPILTTLIESENSILNFIGFIPIFFLGGGIAPTIMGLIGRTGLLGSLLYFLVFMTIIPGGLFNSY